MVLPVIHFPGDWHIGPTGWPLERQNAFFADVPNLPRVAVHMHPGDVTELGTQDEFTDAKALLASLPFPWIAAIGNHDTIGADVSGTLTGDEAAAGLELPQGKNQSHDLGFVHVIVLGHSVHSTQGAYITLTQDTLDYLDAKLTASAPKPTIVMAHAPLYNTVIQTPGQPSEFPSTHPEYHIVAVEEANANNEIRDEPIRDILAAHNHVRAWLSGHTHSPAYNPTLWSSVELGGKHVICGNGSALYYTKPPGVSAVPRVTTSKLISQVMYVLRDRFEIRYYDHFRSRATTGPNDEPLSIIYYDDGLLVHERRAA